MNQMEHEARAQQVFSKLFPEERRADDILEYFFLRMKEAMFEGAHPMPIREDWDSMLEEFIGAYEEADLREREEGKSFLSRFPLRFLTRKEERELMCVKEYYLFLHAFQTERIYLFLKLDRDLHGFSTLEHVLGVHHLAMKLGRDVKRAGLPVDLGVLSGAAAGHDLGKYGVRPSELSRIAYYHYYYSDQWFERRGMERIRNIAVNHSTWDLEPESLSMESLLLIYSDFCVKNDAYGNMRFYTLAEAFRVILDKLDDVDEAKERRYRIVYNKLVDFEAYLIHHGINVDPEGKSIKAPPEKDPALRFGRELTQMIHLEGVRESTQMMHLLRDEESLGALFEEVLAGKEPEDILRLLETLWDYSIYLMPSQKHKILRYLRGLVLHSREDIRRKSSSLRGRIIGEYDIVYRKEIPPKASPNPMGQEMVYLFEDLLYELYRPYSQVSQEKIQWLAQGGYRTIMQAMDRQKGNETLFLPSLLRTISQPIDRCRRHLSYRLIDGMHRRGWVEKGEATKWVRKLIEENPEGEDFHRTLYFNAHSPLFPKELREEGPQQWKALYHVAGSYDTARMYLDNLKTDTPEDLKALSLGYLSATCQQRADPLHLSLHMLNLIRLSSSRRVRRYTFQLVGRTISLLNKEQLNDVSVELLSALTNEDPQSQEFLCALYGELLARLPDAEREEILEEIEVMLKSSAAAVRNALIKAVSYGLKSSLMESKRVSSYLRILFIGLVHAGGRTEQLALVSLAEQVFRAEEVSLEDKAWVLSLCVKKVRLLSKATRSRRIARLSYCSYIGSVYGFACAYEMERGELLFEMPKRIAIYPGSFDPMNLGQKRIVERMSQEGYEVYVLLSELAWGRSLYPYMHRRIIASIHIAPIPGAHLMPMGAALLPEREEDRQSIWADFAPAELTLLGESDGLEAPIRFVDVGRLRREDDSPYMKIHPRMIRYAIREGFDTTEMIDPMAARYIERHHLYLKSQHEKAWEAFTYEKKIDGRILHIEASGDQEQYAQARMKEDAEGVLTLCDVEEHSLDPLHSMFSLLLSEAVFQAAEKPFLRVEATHPLQTRTLKSLGFRQRKGIYQGDYREPLVLVEDLPIRLQKEMRSEPAMRLAIANTRSHLHEELRRLYPDRTILTLSYSMISSHHLRLIDSLGKENLLCVPLSDLFRGQHFGGRRTKALHTQGGKAKEEDNYLSIDHQLRILSKFDSPVLFIDDVAGLSQDLLTLLPRIRSHALEVEGLLSGLVTRAYEKQLDEKEINLFSEHRLPSVRAAFYESDFFPFFGGRTLRTTGRGFQRARNFLFPLNAPAALGHPEGDYLRFSRAVLRMGRDLLEELERVFRDRTDRTLLMEDLFRVFDTARVPEMITIRSGSRTLASYDELIQFAHSLEERWEGK